MSSFRNFISLCFIVRFLYAFARATLTKYHKLVDLTQKCIISKLSQRIVQKSEFEMSEGMAPSQHFEEVSVPHLSHNFWWLFNNLLTISDIPWHAQPSSSHSMFPCVCLCLKLIMRILAILDQEPTLLQNDLI